MCNKTSNNTYEIVMTREAYKNLLREPNMPSNWGDTVLYDELKDENPAYYCRFYYEFDR